MENPAHVGNTDGGYSGNYVDLAKRLQIRPSELQAVWEQAGKPELMWQVINTPGMVEMLKRHGYDGVQAVENGVKAWAVFDSAQVKSAVANNGSFSLTNPDIRYSSQDGRYRDLMGEKAAKYTKGILCAYRKIKKSLSKTGEGFLYRCTIIQITPFTKTMRSDKDTSGTPETIRTSDPSLRRRMLYPLSYWGL